MIGTAAFSIAITFRGNLANTPLVSVSVVVQLYFDSFANATVAMVGGTTITTSGVAKTMHVAGNYIFKIYSWQYKEM